MPINPLNFQILSPSQTPVGAGLNATAQSVQNALMPKMLHAQMFGQEMMPLSVMGQSPMMALLPQYRDAWAQAMGTALKNVAPNAQPITFGDLDQDQLNLYSRLGLLGGSGSNQNQNTQNTGILKGIVSSFAGKQKVPQDTNSNPSVPYNPLAPYIKQYGLTNINNLGGGWFTALSNGKPVKFQVPEVANAN